MLVNCRLITIMVHVTLFHLELCSVLPITPIKIAFRKLNQFSWYFCHRFRPFWFSFVKGECIDAKFFRYDGKNFITEPSSKFTHQYVDALGSYRDSPFVTGSGNKADGLKTEILNYEILEWIQESDYPFANSNR